MGRLETVPAQRRLDQQEPAGGVERESVPARRTRPGVRRLQGEGGLHRTRRSQAHPNPRDLPNGARRSARHDAACARGQPIPMRNRPTARHSGPHRTGSRRAPAARAPRHHAPDSRGAHIAGKGDGRNRRRHNRVGDDEHLVEALGKQPYLRLEVRLGRHGAVVERKPLAHEQQPPSRARHSPTAAAAMSRKTPAHTTIRGMRPAVRSRRWPRTDHASPWGDTLR